MEKCLKLSDMASRNWTPQQFRDFEARMYGRMQRGAPVAPPVPPANGIHDLPIANESELHNEIISYCRAKGWIYLHGNMSSRTHRTIGEWDFTIIADNGRVFFVECKRDKGKLTTEQQAMIAWANKLGHKVYVVRSLSEFVEGVK
jgi:hypothetical protein